MNQSSRPARPGRGRGRPGDAATWREFASGKAPADLVLSLIPAYMRETVQALRELVKESVPGVREKPQPGWKSFNFDHNGALLAISAYQNWASLGFVRGDQLDDPGKLLEGTGKGMRHVKIKRGADIPRQQIAALLEQAARLNEELGPPPGFGRAWGGGA